MLFEIDSVLAPKSHKIWVCLAQQADQLQLSGCSSFARKSLDNLCVGTVLHFRPQYSSCRNKVEHSERTVEVPLFLKGAQVWDFSSLQF